jgi:DNA-binding transcriptional ArsR family regulator
MPDPFEAFTSIDRVIHEPARLSILSALDECRRADFLFLQSLTALSKGNLSQHLSKLENAGLVEIQKVFNKMSHTTVRLTPQGRTAIRAYWRDLERTRRNVSRWGLRFRHAATSHEM